MNHIYFWDAVLWTLAIWFFILKTLCDRSQWVTAPIFWSPVAFSIQLWAILMCSLSLLFSSHEAPLCIGLFAQRSVEPIPQSSDSYIFPFKPVIFPLVTGSVQRSWDSRLLSVRTTKALPKAWWQEIDHSLKFLSNRSNTKAWVELNTFWNFTCEFSHSKFYHEL